MKTIGVISLVTMLSTVSLAIPSAKDSHKLAYQHMAEINAQTEEALLVSVSKQIDVSVNAGAFSTTVKYGHTPYIIAFDVARIVAKQGYIVNIDRASRTFSIAF